MIPLSTTEITLLRGGLRQWLALGPNWSTGQERNAIRDLLDKLEQMDDRQGRREEINRHPV